MSTDPSVQAPPVITSPGPEYSASARNWQGIPGIERASNGRLWATWYTGGEGEGPYNHVVLVTSDDDGETWSEPVLVVDPPGEVRAYDECLWHDPTGTLWLFWAQSEGLYDGRAGVWCITADDSTKADTAWSEPRRVGNGIMMNKPTVLTTGEWLLPTAVWDHEPYRDDMKSEMSSNALCSEDGGKTFAIRGGADIPDRAFDEHMFVERKDDSLWVLVRRGDGMGESTSTDRGRTWTPGSGCVIAGPGTRFFIRRLASGRLLLINHADFMSREGVEDFTPRNNLAATLSDDDGKTWSDPLILDSRMKVSYPDGLQTEDGTIYSIHDHDRGGKSEIIMSVFTEEDIMAGKIVSSQGRLGVIVNSRA
jgi:hypothetical protein